MDTQNQILASRWKRLGGSLLDSVIMLIIILPVMIFLGVFEQAKQGGKISLGHTIFFILFGLLVYLAVNSVLLVKSGQTVGKKIVGTQIVDTETGRIISVWKVFGLRLVPIHLISQIPFIGGLIGLADSLFIFRSDKRCLHDLIAGTKVIELNRFEPEHGAYAENAG